MGILACQPRAPPRDLLVENGFDAVNMSGGLVHWRAAGGPLTAR
ncbi:hypothetical protein Rhow_008511 [Rhodococcus wratislaviensis]|uniref:Rhodanese domain-containing protein n=1 Tax=Rhodococcus wratislaviensis TaxID=44752 RepID=A0A402CKU6_RHOWR|nr:hypothetical protein Rhow_008511 [Rhodococcus wratislaviensis]